MPAAQGQIGDLRGFVDKRRSTAAGAINPATVLATIANYTDLNSIEAKLISTGNAAYTQAKLNLMTMNDKIYAVRLSQDSAGIN